jgi:guanylate kinase
MTNDQRPMTNDQFMKGPLIILSGPSGSGKSTVIALLLERRDLPLHLSVSATTRAPRPGEQDGVAYHFWTRERFLEEVAAEGFLERAEVHGQCYGTLRREVEPFREQGVGVLLDIDVQGFDQVRRKCVDFVSVFLRPGTFEELEKRLRERHTEDEASLQRRLANARSELARAGDYQYQVINDDLGAAVEQFHQIVKDAFERRGHAG